MQFATFLHALNHSFSPKPCIRLSSQPTCYIPCQIYCSRSY